MSTRLTLPLRLLHFALRVAGRLPLSALHRIGSMLGYVLWLGNGRTRHVVERNLALVEASSGIAASTGRVQAILAETGKSLTEIARIWTGNPTKALALVRRVHGIEHFDAALASGRGLIVVAPHLGCWEILNYWLAARTPLGIVYRPPKRASLEPFLLLARGALDVEQIRAEGAGVRVLYKRLQGGGVVGILPDQQPRQGEGQFAPFFGVEALTMVLVPRLAQRTNANVLYAYAQRLSGGAGFDIHIRVAPDGIDDPDLRVACTALNRGVEECARDAFDQYQWQYKRYGRRPVSAGRNPYK
ncbi:MAG: lipid A biosynthesis acyltransferase [Dokdonella sp.]